jgi:symplekin
MQTDILNGSHLKRPAVDEPTDGLDQAKRQRLGADVPSLPPSAIGPPPLPPGPISYAQLFTLTDDPTLASLNVRAIPADMAARTLVQLLRFNVPKDQLEHGMNTIRSRFLAFTTQPTAAAAATQPIDDDEDYEPDYEPTEDAEQLKNRLEVDAPEEVKLMKQTQDSVGPFRLPKPPPMSNEQIDLLALATVDRMFHTIATLPATNDRNEKKRGFYEPVVRGAIDRSAYFRMIVRVGVRPLAGLETAEQQQKAERQTNGESNLTISDHVRQRLLQYILSDWQHRIGSAVTWFTEEWLTEQSVWKEYEETLASTKGNGGDVKPPEPPRHYRKWVLRFIDDLGAYLGGSKNDMKILIRFVSEIPALEKEIVDRVASLAEDPERVTIVAASLRYLIQYRPPTKELCLDALQEVWKYERTAEGPNATLLKKLRPGFVEKTLEIKSE